MSKTSTVNDIIKHHARRIAWLLAGLVIVATLISSRLGINWQPFSGDEPNYLLMANSFATDGDFNIKNNYDARQLADVYPYPAPPHKNHLQFTADSPVWYSVHNAGLPVFIAPALAWLEPKAASAMMLLVALAVLWLTYHWTLQLTRRKVAAWAATLALTFSVSYLTLSGTIFPDLPIAALLLAGLITMERPKRGRWELAALSLVIGLAPWLHMKTLPIFGTIGAIVCYQLVRTKRPRAEKLRDLAALLLAWLLLWVFFELKLHQWYQVWWPSRVYPDIPGIRLFEVSPLFTLPGIGFSASNGLLAHNPLFLLIFCGLPLWAAKLPKQLLRVGLVIVPSLLIQASFAGWWGGFSPAGRFFFAFIPALLPALGFLVLQYRRLAVKLLLIVFASVQLWLAMTAVVRHVPWPEFGARSPLYAEIGKQMGLALDRLLPQFTETKFANQRAKKLVIIDALLVLTLLAYGLRLAGVPARKF